MADLTEEVALELDGILLLIHQEVAEAALLISE